VRGRGVVPVSMSTSTTTAVISTTATGATIAPSVGSTLGARLAAASRRAQGLDPEVSDPSVLAELHGLCAAPRPTRLPVIEKRDGPAP